MKIELHPYYQHRETKNVEMVEAMTYASIWLIIAASLGVIIEHVLEFWRMFEM